MANKFRMTALTGMALAIMMAPLAGCAANSTTASQNAVDVVPVQFEIYLPGYMRDSSPIMLQPYDKDGALLDKTPIAYDQISDNRATIYLPADVVAADIITPVNPDGTTYDFGENAIIEIDPASVNVIEGELVGDEATNEATPLLDEVTEDVEEQTEKLSDKTEKISKDSIKTVENNMSKRIDDND